MKKFLAMLGFAFAAAILLQKRWNAEEKALPKPKQAGPPEPPDRAEVNAASGAASPSGVEEEAEGPGPQQSWPTIAGRTREEILNSATRQQLLSVYGIGPVLADRIIQNRPYAAAYEVVEKGIIPESIYVRLRKQLLDQHSV